MITYPLPHKKIHYSPTRCTTTVLHLQRRYDDSIQEEYKIQIKTEQKKSINILKNI